MELDCQQLAQLIDYALLGQTVSSRDVEEGAREARRLRFASLYVKPYQVSRAANLLHGSEVAVGTVISFPLGGDTTRTKLYQAEEALRDGARELDLMTNLGAVEDGRWDYVEDELRAVVELARGGGAIVKVILEAPLLARDQKVRLCRICAGVGAAYVKTASGFGGVLATAEDVRLLRSVVGNGMGVKASGGVRTLEDLVALVEAGADRIGTSAAVPIVETCAEQGGRITLAAQHLQGHGRLGLT